LVLRNAPITSRNQMVKVTNHQLLSLRYMFLQNCGCAIQDAAFSIVIKVLLSVKSAQMEDAVSALDRELLDILMKYIYRGFEFPSEGSSGHLLAWHEKVHAVAGVGSIVRVLTDKKRV